MTSTMVPLLELRFLDGFRTLDGGWVRAHSLILRTNLRDQQCHHLVQPREGGRRRFCREPAKYARWRSSPRSSQCGWTEPRCTNHMRRDFPHIALGTPS